ncbi:MAG: PEP-utilizing enzyme, partial [Candidatus Micrarchaeota archaeon]
DYLYPEKEFLEITESIGRKAIEDPEFIYSSFRQALEKAVEMRGYSEKYKGKNLREVPSEELIEFSKGISRMFEEFYGYATMAVYLGYRHESPLDEKMNLILREGTKKTPEKFANYLLVLTRPPKRLRNQLLEMEILKLAKIAKNKGIKKIDSILKELLPELEAVKHRFDSLSYNICGSVGWGLGHYANLVSEKMDYDIDRHIRDIENYEKNARDEFVSACRELKLSKQEIGLFEIIRNLGYYKWAREFEFIEGFYNEWPVLKELGRRCGLTNLESMFIMPEEYGEALKNPEKFRKIAQERRECGLAMIENGKFSFLTGKAAEERIRKMEFAHEKVEAGVSELKGMPACAGTAKGTVKIINTAKDMHKMKEGDILISAATSPDLVPAMKKAAAIITNEGGITCHAAIVSRELKIPCVVGVRNANKILKDGDEIDVDANRGLIRKM